MHTGNNINGMVTMFDDTMLLRLIYPGAIAVVVVCAMMVMADGVHSNDEVNLYQWFEVLWLLGPVLFVWIIGVTSGIVRYELLENDWMDVVTIIVAAQWYWSESISNISHENSTLLDEWFAATGVNEAWGFGGTSIDVLHSFSFKEYRFHTDCIPRKCILHVVAYLVERVVSITCQELCRYRHSRIVISFILE